VQQARPNLKQTDSALKEAEAAMINIRGISDPDSVTFYELGQKPSRSLRRSAILAPSVRFCSTKPQVSESSVDRRWRRGNESLDQLNIPDGSRGSVTGGVWHFLAQPDPSRFFTLSSLPQVAQASTEKLNRAGKDVFGIGPVKFPGYLDRQEIVVRSGQNRLEVSEIDRWVEPLQENFSRVLFGKSCAASEHGSDHSLPVVTCQSAAGTTSKSRCYVSRPTATRNGQLFARWSVLDGADKKVACCQRVTRYSQCPRKIDRWFGGRSE